MAHNLDPGAWDRHAGRLHDAIGIANEFLARWDDVFTDSIREDVGQQTAVSAVLRFHTLRDPANFPAFVRTIARRKRANEVRQVTGCRGDGVPARWAVAEPVSEPQPEPGSYLICGRWICRGDMLRVLPEVLGQLPPLNARLLLGFYEGFSCVELAARFGLTPNRVKVRIHRARCRVKQLFERMIMQEKGELRRDRRAGGEIRFDGERKDDNSDEDAANRDVPLPGPQRGDSDHGTGRSETETQADRSAVGAGRSCGAEEG